MESIESTDNLTITFIDSDKQYVIPIQKLNKHPDSFFSAYIRFEKKYEYKVTICSHDEFKNVFEFIVNDKQDILNYVSELNLFDYFGLHSNIMNGYMKIISNKYQKISNFIQGQIDGDKYFLVNNLDEYLEYKKLFSKESHIIPFQYINATVDVLPENVNKFFLDTLFIGNGECCDFGNVHINEKLEFTQNNYFDFKKQDKNMPIGLPFDWLSNIRYSEIKLFYEKFDDLVNDEEYSRYCISSMNKTYCNEIEYLISGMKLIYNETDKIQEWLSWIPVNNIILDKHIDKYKESNIKYNYNLPDLKLNDFKIRQNLCNDEYPSVINQVIFYNYYDEFNDDVFITCEIMINGYFGFINTNTIS